MREEKERKERGGRAREEKERKEGGERTRGGRDRREERNVRYG